MSHPPYSCQMYQHSHVVTGDKVFNEWIINNSLQDIKHLFIKHKANTPNALRYTSTQFNSLISDQELLTQKSYMIPTIMQAMKQVHTVKIETKKHIVITEAEETAINNAQKENATIIKYTDKINKLIKNTNYNKTVSEKKINSDFGAIINALRLRQKQLLTQLENVKKDKINTFEKQLNVLNSCNKQYNDFNNNSNRMLYDEIIERNNRKQMIVNDANSCIENAKRVQIQTENVLETVKDTFMVQFAPYKSFVDDFGNICRDKPKRKRSLSTSTKNSDDEIIILHNPEKKRKLNKKQMLHMEGGIQYRDMKIGSGELIKNGDKVNVFYVGQTDDKQVFDKSISGNGFEFTAGSGDVIKGWDIGLKGVRVGGKRKLVIPPKYAYGSNGVPPSIPGNATVRFTVEVKSVN